MLQKIKNRRGSFSGVEIMIVIAIIAVFAAVVITDFNEARKKSEASKAKSETAQAEYKGRTITLEWKQGVRATPEIIEVVEGVSEINVNECNELVLTLAGGIRRTIPKDNLAEYKEGQESDN